MASFVGVQTVDVAVWPVPEQVVQVLKHAVFRPPETGIGVAWNVLPVHAVHTMSDDTVPAVA